MTQFSFSISEENCQYRGEGNACLVVRLKKEGKVLRLAKEDNNEQSSVSAEDVLKKLERQVELVRTVMRPLLGEDLVHCPVIVLIRRGEIKTINEIVRCHRPAQRCSKSVKEMDTYVLMLPDYCSLPPTLSAISTLGPVISIEIKPKQGFMIKNSISSHSEKSLVCQFCMMQYYKLQKGVISIRSGYCPMDLFSGCPKRMYHALQELIKTPQNNFRIFKDQELVYSEEKKSDLNSVLKNFFGNECDENHTERLCKLVIETLLKPICAITSSTEEKYIYNSQFCSNSFMGCPKHGADTCHGLPKNSVLDRILQVQKLDTLDIASLYPLFLQLNEFSQKQYLDVIGAYSRCQLPPHMGERKKMSCESELEYASRKVWEFLVALTLKDCSLMLVLNCLTTSASVVPPACHVIHDQFENSYLFSLAITDLDSKPLSKVEKVFQDRHCMVEAYRAATQNNTMQSDSL